jgi:hypothetical protein
VNGEQNYMGPPLRVDSTLRMAWGITLTLSREQGQIGTGKNFFEMFEDLRRKTTLTDEDRMYVDNLFTLLGSYFRTIAIERGTYFDYIGILHDQRDTTIKYYNDLANMSTTSFSEGLAIRIASFLDIGSIFSLVGQKSNSLLALHSFNAWFLIRGLVGFIGAIVLVNAYANKKIREVQFEALIEQQKVWRDKAWNGYKKSYRVFLMICASLYNTIIRTILMNQF